MSNKVARRRTDGTYDFLTLLVPIIMLAPHLVVITIICLVGAVLDSFNQRGYLQGQRNERKRGLTLKKREQHATI
jgi:heme exporter protein D